MVIAGGVAGIVATLVALFAQLRHRSRYINTNEIANGILGSLVAITGCCPYIAAEQVQEERRFFSSCLMLANLMITTSDMASSRSFGFLELLFQN